MKKLCIQDHGLTYNQFKSKFNEDYLIGFKGEVNGVMYEVVEVVKYSSKGGVNRVDLIGKEVK